MLWNSEMDSEMRAGNIARILGTHIDGDGITLCRAIHHDGTVWDYLPQDYMLNTGEIARCATGIWL